MGQGMNDIGQQGHRNDMSQTDVNGLGPDNGAMKG